MNRSFAWGAVLMDELARSGVRHVVVSPGSRSAPLALAAAAHEGLRDWSVLDERAAGFFALGLARASAAPVALVCTSGTAAANYLPAVAEASHSRVPLVLLTADRPPELRGIDAGQTLDQLRLYGGFAREFIELAPPEPTDELLRYLRASACRAVACARGPEPGAVHVNVPLRDPLAPLAVDEERARLGSLSALARLGRDAATPFTRVADAGPALPAPDEIERLARALGTEARGWIAVGPLAPAPGLAEAIARLARALGWPVLAEPLSQLRCGTHDRTLLVDAHDAVLRSARFADAHAPALVLRFGASPTSKAYRTALERWPELRSIHVDPHGWSAPSHRTDEIVRADPRALAEALAARLVADGERPWAFAARWVEAGRTARAALDAQLDSLPALSEPGSVRELALSVPHGTTVLCASSMPVRDVDAFWPASDTRLRFLANRGVNGIDGTLATALGTAAAGDGPCVVLLGDLALLHDASSLALARQLDVPLTVVVADNAGGGIFELLPVANAADRAHFERHFATPPGVDIESVVRGFGLPCQTVRKRRELQEALGDALESPGVRVIRVPSGRRANAELHAGLFAAVDTALAARARE